MYKNENNTLQITDNLCNQTNYFLHGKKLDWSEDLTVII